ncbi:MAG: lyase family protein, partial [Candidatus Bathyarchaeia archaeon]
ELIFLCALIASSLDKFASEVRELQRTEIGEVYEPFEKKRQVGSSTMSHKRNPEICERVCGLAKVVRGLVVPALENVPTWQERDLTQSSSERFIIPEACILIDYMLHLMINVLSNLEIDEERMKKNLVLTEGRAMSEAVMLLLVRKGLGRQEAHELIRQLAIKSESGKIPFRTVLLQEEMIHRIVDEKEIDDALNPENYLGTSARQIDLAIEKTIRERQNRGLTT